MRFVEATRNIGWFVPETAELLSATRTPLLRKPFKVEEIRGTVQRFFLATESFFRRDSRRQ